MTDDDKCSCPDCRGNHDVPRRFHDAEKCLRCGRIKRKHRQCQCEEPIVFTHTWKPGDPGPMYGGDDDLLIDERIDTKPKAVYKAKIRISGYRRGKPSSFIADE